MSTSAFAGSPLLICPALLYKDGLITKAQLESIPEFTKYTTDFNGVWQSKKQLLKNAFSVLSRNSNEGYQTFAKDTIWLDDYAYFMCLKKIHGDIGWFDWPEEFVNRKPKSVQRLEKSYAESINYFKLEQYF